MIKPITYILLFMFYLFTACNTVENKEEMIKYVSETENGLLKEKKISGTEIKLMLKPSILFAMQEIEGQTKISEKEKQEIINQYNKQLYFVLSISRNNEEVLNSLAGNKQQFGSMVNELAFGLEQNAKLITSNADTLNMIASHFVRTYGVGRSSDVLLVFENKHEKYDWIKLFIKEFGLETGDISFKFEKADIENIPELN